MSVSIDPNGGFSNVRRLTFEFGPFDVCAIRIEDMFNIRYFLCFMIFEFDWKRILYVNAYMFSDIQIYCFEVFCRFRVFAEYKFMSVNWLRI